MPQHLTSTGYDQQGLATLREAIARRYCERGLVTQADEVMIVNGALSGLALVLRLMTGPGDRVVVDAPTYPMAISAIQEPPAGRLAWRCPPRAGTVTAWRQPLRKPPRAWPG